MSARVQKLWLSPGTIIDDAEVRAGSVLWLVFLRLITSLCALAALQLAWVPRAHADAPEDELPADDGRLIEEDMPDSLPDDPSLVPEESSALPLRFEGTLSGALALQLSEKDGASAYGFAVTYGVAWGSIPVMLGIDFMSVTANDHVSNIALQVPEDGSSLLATKRARDRSMCFDLWLRVQPARWPVRPYIEGFWGAKLIQTQYSLQVGADESESMLDSAWVSNLGWGAGVDFWGLFNAGGTVSLTLGVRQLFSADAQFKRALVIEDRGVIADYSMPTSMFVISAGIMGQFDLSARDDPYAAH